LRLVLEGEPRGLHNARPATRRRTVCYEQPLPKAPRMHLDPVGGSPVSL
jgi:hypothetical protein